MAGGAGPEPRYWPPRPSMVRRYRANESVAVGKEGEPRAMHVINLNRRLAGRIPKARVGQRLPPCPYQKFSRSWG